MWIFLQFYKRFKKDLLFVFLLLVGFIFLYNSNSYQGAIINNTLLTINGWFNGLTTSVTKYFGLERKNRELIAQMNKMSNEVNPNSGNYSYDLAQVVYLDMYKENNYLIINKGSNQGVKEHMVVISPENSVVGEIKHCAANYSLVLSILNTQQKTAGKLPDGTVGLVYWTGLIYGRMSMDNIPSYLEVAIGDTIRTSGQGIYPPDLLIGTIRSKSVNTATKFTEVDINLCTNFHRLYNVRLIEDKDLPVKDSLIQMTQAISGNEP